MYRKDFQEEDLVDEFCNPHHSTAIAPPIVQTSSFDDRSVSRVIFRHTAVLKSSVRTTCSTFPPQRHMLVGVQPTLATVYTTLVNTVSGQNGREEKLG